ncbi:hypothetical protein ES319_D09G052900v1 [Gossypium barbadense]|uniref:Uncharacterized protein n=2 Tax=Gossypium TaxID=3633 RepID=A0A5J5PZ79_GOSBA|nr:hypothetical protein ES319_D09G052900v1 [Gossypium barbadense]KAB2011917.1 hypothetical protein ES319_D09G052900v1 [Gossypium barbadense]TYG52857.1 hypothetical protein ES288_D09G062000v1 [Gossypium darwinii]TYG52858.1 hypothetical protein ES288_D09G062000v1 [Gossypium darwinii]
MPRCQSKIALTQQTANSKQPSTKSQLTNLPSGSQLLISQSESQIFSRENPPFLLSISLPAH